MRGDECQGKAKLVPSTRNKPMHNAKNTSMINTLGECLLKVKGVLQLQPFAQKFSNLGAPFLFCFY